MLLGGADAPAAPPPAPAESEPALESLATPDNTPTPTPTPPSESLSAMVKQARPAVVRITTNTGSGGSGAIFDTQGRFGYVITNHHVIDGASRVTVVVNDFKDYTGTVLGVDRIRDLAVIRIYGNGSRFQKLDFGDASSLESGDEIIAIGYALGIEGEATITRGIVSAIRFDSDYRSHVIQTDAAVNPGNSGGPILSLDGKILGITTFRREETQSGRRVEGLNFAISATTVQQQIPSLRTVSARPTPTPTRRPTRTPSARPTPTPFPTRPTSRNTFGPIDGELRHDPDDGFIKVESANVSMSDLVVSATFVNPYSIASKSWDYGLFLRYRGTGASTKFLHVAVTSQRRWEVALREGSSSDNQRIAGGSLSRFNTSANSRNHLQLVAVAERGWLFVNGEFISSLDLSNITGAGDVSVITGAFTGNEVAGAVTRFEDFQGSRLTHDYGPASGKLEYEPSFVSMHDIDVFKRNFIAEAEFTNPVGNDWDYGFAFRHPASNDLDVIVVTDHNWWHHDTRDLGDDEYTEVDDGRLPSGSFRNTNHLLLLAIDEVGLFFVNDQLIARLDLSHNLARGDISAIGRYFDDHTGEPEFRNFNVWTMD